MKTLLIIIGSFCRFALWGNAMEETDPQLSTSPIAGNCPPDQPYINCLVDPCRFAKCPGFPLATCRPNYCGGCKAEFYFKDMKVPAEKCKEVCQAEEFHLSCTVDPCKDLSCPKVKGAKCWPNYCGGCHADFFLGDYKLSHQHCHDCPITFVRLNRCVRCIRTCPRPVDHMHNVFCFPLNRCVQCTCPSDTLLDLTNWRCVKPNLCPNLRG